MDYANGRIYKILNSIDDEVYVGSTCQSLSKRMYKHKDTSKYSLDKKSPLYQLMRQIGEDSFYIELIESYPCNSKEELTAREGHFIRECGTLNKRIEGRTRKEYKVDNNKLLVEQNRTYRENHKEQIKQYKVEYYEANKHIIGESMKTIIVCECGREVRKCALNRHLNTKVHQQIMEQRIRAIE